MKFLDANVFVYAYYRPRGNLNRLEKKMKEGSKEIVRRVSEGKEEIITTVVHLSETVNILKHGSSVGFPARLLRGLYSLENVTVLGVTPESCLAASDLGEELDLEPNDALALGIMRSEGIEEIHSFDRDFDGLEGVTRLPHLPK